MTIESWYYTAGIGSFVVALLGLLGLAFYTFETRKLRIATEKQLKAVTKQVDAMQQQLEAAITPCVLVFESQSRSTPELLSLKNCGTGVALNIRLRYSGDDTNQWTEFAALGPSETRPAPFSMSNLINVAVECEFESISGARYSTRSGHSAATTNLALRHEFKRMRRND